MLKKHLPLLIFLTLYFFVITYKLITHPTPFFDWDESINVQVAKEMIKNKSLTPLWQGNVWLDKPPLPFLIFGVIMKLTPFIQPEISLRITALLLSLISLVLIYILFNKATKDKILPLMAVIITSFTPIFLQRSQIVNLDVFLLIGWLGYLMFVHNFWLSFIFLAIAVLTKSLIGFYPIPIILSFKLFSYIMSLRAKRSEKKQSLLELMQFIKQAIFQTGILLIWYVAMFLIFGKNFWQQHIIETHFMRVTASIESHFGQRTYYLDLMFEQLGPFMWLAVVGLILATINSIKRYTGYGDRNILLNYFYLLPWFIFLNLTKTKISWYLYPAVPQFAFLAVYPLSLMSFPRRWESRQLGFLIKSGTTIAIATFVIFYIYYQNFIKTDFFTTFYSKPENYYHLALYARDKCDSLNILVGKETREANKTLKDLELTITSTTQWGDHPSMVYYFGKKVNFIYDEKNLFKDQLIIKRNSCLVVRKDDLNLNFQNIGFKRIDNFKSYSLFER